MKKILLLSLVISVILGNTYPITAQCYGTVNFDKAVSAGVISNCGNSTFSIVTAYPDELILISYNGWNGPGSGPVTVDGNAATFIATANNGNSGSAEVYAYSAPAAGTHNIVCTESGYNSCYYDNFAAAFYATGSCSPISIGNLTFTLNTIACTTGGSISDNITTTTPGSMIYCSTEINEGQPTSYPISYTGATFLGNEHTEDGIDAAHAYTPAATPGVYAVTATNSSPPNNGCGGLVIILVDITPPACSSSVLSVTSSFTTPSCGYCNGKINISASGGSPPYTYTWNPPVSSAASASNLCAGSYSITVKDAVACDDTTVVVTLPSSGGMMVTANVTANEPCYGNCVGSAVSNVTGGSTPYTYQWSPSGGSDSAANTLCAEAYTVTVHDANGCTGTASVTITQPTAIIITASSSPADSACTGENVTLNASGANTYLWSTGATTSSITVVIPGGDSAHYGVKGVVGSCSDSTSIKIKIIPRITASVNISKDSICPGGTTTITAAGAGGQATYRWNTGATTSSITVSDTVTTTYTIGVYGLCDTIMLTKTVNVIPLPKPIISGSPVKCKGTKDTLFVSSSINPTTYIWSNGSTKTSIITGAINGDSTIYVTAENSLGCSVKDSFKITEKLYPTGSVTYNPTCINSPDIITARASGMGPFTYRWSTGGTYDTANIIITDTTTYTVTISNGCSITKTVTISPDIPNLSVCCNTSILRGGDTTIVASGTDIVLYQWAPDTGLNCTTCATVIASPTTTTTYTVTGTDGNGCYIQRMITIIVETPCNIMVPNVFTPTYAGTGNDNEFYINTNNSNITSWSVLIYDRWGKEIYKSTNPSQYWDGKTENGAQASAGVYYYLIDGGCQGSSYKKQGYVQLIR